MMHKKTFLFILLFTANQSYGFFSWPFNFSFSAKASYSAIVSLVAGSRYVALRSAANLYDWANSFSYMFRSNFIFAKLNKQKNEILNSKEKVNELKTEELSPEQNLPIELKEKLDGIFSSAQGASKKAIDEFNPSSFDSEAWQKMMGKNGFQAFSSNSLVYYSKDNDLSPYLFKTASNNRLETALIIEDIIQRLNLTKIAIPKKYNYHIPGTDKCFVVSTKVVNKKIDRPLTEQEIEQLARLLTILEYKEIPFGDATSDNFYKTDDNMYLIDTEQISVQRSNVEDFLRSIGLIAARSTIDSVVDQLAKNMLIQAFENKTQLSKEFQLIDATKLKEFVKNLNSTVF